MAALIRLIVLLGVGILAIVDSFAAQSPGHRLFAAGNRFLLEDRATGVVRPFDMWNTRIANALMDGATTDRVVAALDDYRRYGVNTICVSIQGAELGPNKNQLYPRAFLTDGTRDVSSPVWANLERLLDETDRRGMIVNVMIWYHRRNGEVPVDADVVAATHTVASWLQGTGHRNYFYDIVNEFGHYAYRLPGASGRRPIFSTLEGALALVDAVKASDEGVLVGVSPLSALQCPLGSVHHPKPRVVESDVIIGHGTVIDPTNRNAYRLGVSPPNPLAKPYVNNEFFSQLRYELYIQQDPRTGALTYGHWDQATVSAYLADVVTLRGYGGSPNVFSHYQQYVPPFGQWPTFEVGPAGTQPESTLAPDEGSMHWLFRAIAGYRAFGATPFSLDFDHGHGSGLDERIAGTWAYANRRIEQRDSNASPAWARIAADDGDVEFAFDAGFLAAPNGGWLGVQIGGPKPTDGAIRVEVDAAEVRVVEVATSNAPIRAPVTKRALDRYVVRIAAGRAQVAVNGVRVIDAPVAGSGIEQNLLLLTDRATATFDNVRLTPLRATNFEDGTSGRWQSETPANGWSVRSVGPSNRAWEVTVGAGGTGLASIDRTFADATFGVTADFGTASSLGVRLRAANPRDTSGDGYTVSVTRAGVVTLVRDVAGAPSRSLASATVSVAAARVRIAASTAGRRVVVAIDGVRVIDVVDADDAPRRGGFQLLAATGTTRFDDIDIEAGADRWPDVALASAAGPPLSAGTTLSFTDGDGALDLAFMGLEVALGGGAYIDATLFLDPFFGVFAMRPTSRGYRFTVTRSIPVPPASSVRLTAVDRAGQRTVRTFPLP